VPDHSVTLTFVGGTPGVIHLHLGDTVALDTSALTAAVSSIESVGDSVVEVLNRIVAELHAMTANAANSVDPAEVQALADRLTAQSAEIAAAVEHATQPETPPAPEPNPEPPAPQP